MLACGCISSLGSDNCQEHFCVHEGPSLTASLQPRGTELTYLLQTICSAQDIQSCALSTLSARFTELAHIYSLHAKRKVKVSDSCCCGQWAKWAAQTISELSEHSCARPFELSTYAQAYWNAFLTSSRASTDHDVARNAGPVLPGVWPSTTQTASERSFAQGD